MIMQGYVISCGTVVFFQKSRNLSRSLLTNNNFYCVMKLDLKVTFLFVLKKGLKMVKLAKPIFVDGLSLLKNRTQNY